MKLASDVSQLYVSETLSEYEIGLLRRTLSAVCINLLLGVHLNLALNPHPAL